MSRRSANKKLTKLYWPSRKRSPKWLIVLLEQGHDPKNISCAIRRTSDPHYEIHSGATGLFKRTLILKYWLNVQ